MPKMSKKERAQLQAQQERAAAEATRAAVAAMAQDGAPTFHTLACTHTERRC